MRTSMTLGLASTLAATALFAVACGSSKETGGTPTAASESKPVASVPTAPVAVAPPTR